MFKKLRKQILIQEARNINLSEDERAKIEIAMVFGNLLESLEASQDLKAMYGSLDKKENTLIVGGKADKLSVEDIAKKHSVSVEIINKQIEKGVKVEEEHVGKDSAKAREIAMDHLVEFPDYYDRLLKMEKDGKKYLSEAVFEVTVKDQGGNISSWQYERENAKDAINAAIDGFDVSVNDILKIEKTNNEKPQNKRLSVDNEPIMETTIQTKDGSKIHIRQAMEYLSPNGDLTEEGKKAVSDGKIVIVKETDLNEVLILPRNNESKDDFISRFMGSGQAKKDFPEHKQRVAVAFSQWEKHLKESSMAGVAGIISANPGDHGQPVDIDSEKIKEINKQK
jgi:hypothetical protein